MIKPVSSPAASSLAACWTVLAHKCHQVFAMLMTLFAVVIVCSLSLVLPAPLAQVAETVMSWFLVAAMAALALLAAVKVLESLLDG